MFDLTIPHPKHPFKKYSTRQLKAWYERCALMEAILDREGTESGLYGQERRERSDVVRWIRWDIDDVLWGRGVPQTELETMYRLAFEDVNS